MKMKQLITCAAAAMLTASWLTAPVSAAVSTSTAFDPSKTGSITLVKLRENDGIMKKGTGLADSTVKNPGIEGIEFKAVRIAEYATGIDSGSIGTYFSNPDADFLALLAEKGIQIEEEKSGLYTAEAIDSALTAMRGVTGTVPGEARINKYVKAHASYTFPKTDGAGKAVLSGLPLGLYLVAETDTSGYIKSLDPEGVTEIIENGSSPFLIALPMTNQAKIGSSKAGTVWQYDVTAYPKNATVSIPKYIVSESDNKTLLVSDDREIGSVVTQVIAPSAPAVLDGRDYEKYVISDRMDTGLAFLKVKEVRLGACTSAPESTDAFAGFTVLKSGTDYTVSGNAGEHSFSVALTKTGLAKLNAQEVNSQIAVFFEARLTRDAAEGQAVPNTNQPSLTWKNSNTEETSLKGNIPQIFSYHINVKKKGLADASKATFRIRKQDAGEDLYFVMESSGIYHFFDGTEDDDALKTQDLHPAKKGELSIRGFDEGNYEFTELATESGHELLKSPILIELTAHDPKDGGLARARASSDGKSADLTITKGTASFSVDNQSSLILKTGGPGVTLLYVSGAVLASLAAAAGGLLAARNKRGRHSGGNAL